MVVSKITRFRDKYRCYSNFHPSIIVDDFGIKYPTVEHVFQASKTLNRNERRRIARMKTPAEAKKYGRKVKLRDDWEEVKVSIMKAFVRQKFSNNPALKKILLNSGNAIIEEQNNWSDTFWGIDERTGKGENHLGRILMEIREELSS